MKIIIRRLISLSFFVFLYLMFSNVSFSQTKIIQKDDKVIGIDGIEGVDGNWPNNFTLGATYWVYNYTQLYYFYYSPYTSEPYHCPNLISHHTVSEDHNGQYKTNRIEVTWRLYKDGSIFYDEFWDNNGEPLTNDETWNYLQHTPEIIITDDGNYYWDVQIKQHRNLLGWKTLLDFGQSPTGVMYIDVFEDHEVINNALDNNSFHQVYAMQDIVLNPGFEYDPNSGKEFFSAIKDCPSKIKEDLGGDEQDVKKEDFKLLQANSAVSDFNKEFVVYPNPSHDGRFEVVSNIDKSSFVRVYDSYGRQVYKSGSFYNMGIVVDLSNQSKGTYIIQIITDQKVTTKKVVIAN